MLLIADQMWLSGPVVANWLAIETRQQLTAAGVRPSGERAGDVVRRRGGPPEPNAGREVR